MDANVDDDLWLQPGNGVDQGQAGGWMLGGAHQHHHVLGLHHHFSGDFRRSKSHPDPELMAKLSFNENELKVGLDEIKTYSCLYLILDDMEELFKAWKNQTKHRAHVLYAENAEVAEKMKLEGERFNMFIDSHFHQLNDKDKEVVISSVTFLKVFHDEQSFRRMLTHLRCMKRQVLQSMCPALNDLIQNDNFTLEIWEVIWPMVVDRNKMTRHRFKLKTNIKQGDEAALEDDLITNTFGAAANPARHLMNSFFTRAVSLTRHSQQVAFVSKVTHMIHDMKCKFSALMDLVGEDDDEEQVDLVSLMKKEHYVVKQLQLKSYENRQQGPLGICGQSAELLVTAKQIKDKMILTLWNKVNRRVMSTISLCSFGCHTVLTFMIQGELFVVLLGNPHTGHFFFFVLRCNVANDGSNQISDANSWPHPVTMREVGTSGRCKEVTFHMFSADNGDLVWLAVFQDQDGTHVAFFDSASGAEIERQSLDPKCATLQALRDDKAIFLDHDTGMFGIYEFGSRFMHTVIKVSVHTLLLLPGGSEECKYRETSTKMAAFDQSNANNFVLFSPRGECVFLDSYSLEVTSKVTTAMPEPLFEYVFKQDYLAEKHCLVDGILFFLVQDRESYMLKATDLRNRSDAATIVDICGFVKSKFSPEQHFERFDINEELGLANANLAGPPRGHCVPYAFAKSSKEFDKSSKNCLSYMWTLLEGSKYKLHYCHHTDTVFIAGAGDGNFVEVKILRENSVGIRARQAAKQRSIQAMWKNN